MKVGVLALQGAFIEHENVLVRLGVRPVEVRLPEHLEGLDGLIIPGGESTTMGILAQKWGLLEPLRAFARSGRPVWGTCAGMILLAKEVVDGVPGQPILGLMDITVRRNAFGRQVDSFEADLEIPALGAPPFHAVFIRAPVIEQVAPGVEVLASLEDGTAVAVRQGHLLATAFHPELTGDVRFHRYFLRLAG
ncbi:MAG: pyridoxal 5'-phosphate synthase glutaminase subunit PdxT [Anaerolineae bacterium]